MTAAARGKRPTRFALVLAFVFALPLATACGPARYSHLDVYDRTTVPIVFSASRSTGQFDYYVAACSDAHFIYGTRTDGWAAVDPSAQPSPAPSGAVRFLVYPGPPADGIMDTTAAMTSTGLQVGVDPAGLPSCAGVAPSLPPGQQYVPPVPHLTDAETAWCLAHPHWAVDLPRAAASLGLRMTDYYAEASAAANGSPRGEYTYERAALDAQGDVARMWACDAAFAASH